MLAYNSDSKRLQKKATKLFTHTNAAFGVHLKEGTS